jgi:hypothetical protein
LRKKKDKSEKKNTKTFQLQTFLNLNHSDNESLTIEKLFEIFSSKKMFSQVAERPLGEEFTRPSSPEYPRPSHLLWHQQRQQQHGKQKNLTSKLGCHSHK